MATRLRKIGLTMNRTVINNSIARACFLDIPQDMKSTVWKRVAIDCHIDTIPGGGGNLNLGDSQIEIEEMQGKHLEEWLSDAGSDDVCMIAAA